MQKNIKEILVPILLLTGLFLIGGSSQNITGAFIGVSEITSLLNTIIGFSLIMGSCLLFISGKIPDSLSLEGILLEGKQLDSTKRPIIVLDEGAFIGNKPYLHDILNKQSLGAYGYDKIIIPRELKRKLHKYSTQEIRDIAENYAIKSPDYPSMYKEIAKYILQHTGKNKVKHVVLPKIDSIIEEARKNAIAQVSRLYPNNSKQIVKEAERKYGEYFAGEEYQHLKQQEGAEGIFKRYSSGRTLSRKQIGQKERKIMTSKECKPLIKLCQNKHKNRNPSIIEIRDCITRDIKDVDEGDIDVLATALYELRYAPKNTNIIIYARDIDLEEAVTSLKRELPYLEDAISEDVQKGALKMSKKDILYMLKGQLSRLKYKRVGRYES